MKHARCHWLLLAERVEAVRDDAGPDRGSAGMDAIERLEHRQNLLTGESGEKSCCKSAGVISHVMVRIIDRCDGSEGPRFTITFGRAK